MGLLIENKIIKISVLLGVFLSLFFFIYNPLLATADEKKPDKEDKQIDPSAEADPDRLGINIFPILYYTPETKVAFGLSSFLTYRFGLLSKETRPSSLFLAAIYTQMKQFTLQVKPELYLQNNSLYLTGNFMSERFPTKLWGIGPNTEDSMEESYTPQRYIMDLSLQKKIFAEVPVYLGLRYQLESFKIVEKEPGKLLDQNLVPGSTGGLISGPGFIITYDSRDNIFYPSSGYYLQLFGLWNNHIFGSDYDYLNVKADLRSYITLGKNQTLVLQFLAESNSGEVPFHKLARIGGDSLLRGFYGGRFRDKKLLAFQTEYRFSLWKRLGAVVFGGLGNLAENFNSLTWDNLKFAAGFGFRFKVIPRENVNVRVDFAFGSGTHGIYLSAGEAF
ncbi:MAG: BamA/TamA family outer membrane protein [Candidatus Saccharicenans sp.]|nr:BamA/TamA family outer membrane protein [Candidatus Saccharicenans sp.]